MPTCTDVLLAPFTALNASKPSPRHSSLSHLATNPCRKNGEETLLFGFSMGWSHEPGTHSAKRKSKGQGAHGFAHIVSNHVLILYSFRGVSCIRTAGSVYTPAVHQLPESQCQGAHHMQYPLQHDGMLTATQRLRPQGVYPHHEPMAQLVFPRRRARIMSCAVLSRHARAPAHATCRKLPGKPARE